jgi:hypothetical protein
VDLLHSHYLQDVDRYESIRQKAGFAYQQVISSLTDKSLLHYSPNVYLVPFMIVKKYKVGSYLSKVLFYRLTYPDVKDFHRFAIYINVHLIEKYPNHIQTKERSAQNIYSYFAEPLQSRIM